MRNALAAIIIASIPLGGSWGLWLMSERTDVPPRKVEHLLEKGAVFIPARKPLNECITCLSSELRLKPTPYDDDPALISRGKLIRVGSLEVSQRAVRGR